MVKRKKAQADKRRVEIALKIEAESVPVPVGGGRLYCRVMYSFFSKRTPGTIVPGLTS